MLWKGNGNRLALILYEYLTFFCVSFFAVDVVTMETDIKVRFTFIITNWVRVHFEGDKSNEFPLDIVQLIVNIFLYEKVKFLSFSPEFKGQGVELSEDRKCAKKSETASSGNIFIAPDCTPVKEGICVWRIKVTLISILINSIYVDILKIYIANKSEKGMVEDRNWTNWSKRNMFIW